MAAEINGVVKELSTAIKSDASIKFFTFEDKQGKEVYWHSTSHLMAHAIQSLHPEAKFGVGPAIDAGFYYDIDINDKLTEEKLAIIENRMMELVKADSPFVRSEHTKAEALKFFGDKGE